jgi:LytR cell envelope-related transcriptional attenuator
MSTSRGTRASGRLRTAGLALFALAVIAVIIGLLVAVNRDEQTTATGNPAAPPTDVPSSSLPSSSVIPYPPPVPSFPAQAPVVPVVPPSVPPAAEEGPVSDEDSRRGAVRVYNNSTIRGLAARAADDLSAAGWTVAEVGNYAQGTIPTTTVYYQEGTDEQTAAEAIGTEFGMRVEPRFAGIENADPGLIVIVTNDYAR